MLAHELNITPSPSTLCTRWMWGASTADYSMIYIKLPRETSRAPPQPFLFHRFWDELILSTAMKPDRHTLYFSSTSSEHHHVNPLAAFRSIFPLTLPQHLYLGHLKDRWRQQTLLKQTYNIYRRTSYQLQIKGFISTVVDHSIEWEELENLEELGKIEAERTLYCKEMVRHLRFDKAIYPVLECKRWVCIEER